MRIGDEEAAQREAAAAHADASARAQQQLRLRQQQLEVQATAAAQKHQAQQGYQQAIAQGMDPTQAILKFGPGMNAGAAMGTALRLAQPKAPVVPPAIQMITQPDGTQVPVMIQGGKVVPRSEWAAPVVKPEPTTKWVPESEATGPAHWEHGGVPTQPRAAAPDISNSERQQALSALREDAKRFQDENPGLLEKRARLPATLSPAEKDTLSEWDDIQRQRKALLPALQNGRADVPHGTSVAPTGGGNKVFNYDPDSDKLVPQGGGAALAPGQPAAPAAVQPALPAPVPATKPPSIVDSLGLPPMRAKAAMPTQGDRGAKSRAATTLANAEAKRNDQIDAEAKAWDQATAIFEKLSKANTGRGTFMAEGEYNKNRQELEALLQTYPDFAGRLRK